MVLRRLYLTQSVLDLVKLTLPQNQFIKENLEIIKIMETQEKLNQKSCQTLISWSQDFLAKHFQSLVEGKVSTIQEAHSFLKSHRLSGKNNHAFYCLKTSRGFYLTKTEAHLLPSLPKLMNWATTVNGVLLTARITESRKTGSALSLSDILEPIEDVDQKYFLSQKSVDKLLGYQNKKLQPLPSSHTQQTELEGGSYVVESTIEKIGNVNPSGTGMNGDVFSEDGLAPTLTTNKGEGIKIAQVVPKVICYNSERGLRDKNIYKKGGGSGILSRDDGLSYAITAQNHHMVMVQIKGGAEASRVYDPLGISKTIKGGGGQGAMTGLYAVPIVKYRNIYLGTAIYNGKLVCIRRLTPRECERLQGFEDDWTKFGKNDELISDTQRYKCIGNAVTTKKITNIIRRLKPHLIDKESEEKILIPRVVSFSGGRTSAMMLLQLLERGELKQWRGDCVVFNNTSAEHSATYAFVSRIKKITEEKYNIPFFMTEFCTYEAKTSRGHTRRITYKLINDLPYCKHTNPHGYKFKGEVFEEMISQTGVLPSYFQRSCTINMKILTTNNFLSDWFSFSNQQQPYIEQQGEILKSSSISDADIVKKHRMYRGELSDEAIIDKKVFVRSCQTFRPKQLFKDFTKAGINYSNAYLREKAASNNGRISLFGKNGVKYHNYIGIRYDEKIRAVKIRKRIKDAKINLSRRSKNKIKSAIGQPAFEIAQMPMIKKRISKEKVISFWQDSDRSKYDLDLSYDGLLSNCVHCMLKGKSKNQLIAIQNKNSTLGNSIELNDGITPSSIHWWKEIEKRYSRKVIKSSENKYTNIGFFGASKDYVYQTWIEELDGGNEEDLIRESEQDGWTMDCNCTD